MKNVQRISLKTLKEVRKSGGERNSASDLEKKFGRL